MAFADAFIGVLAFLRPHRPRSMCNGCTEVLRRTPRPSASSAVVSSTISSLFSAKSTYIRSPARCSTWPMALVCSMNCRELHSGMHEGIRQDGPHDTLRTASFLTVMPLPGEPLPHIPATRAREPDLDVPMVCVPVLRGWRMEPL